MIPVILSAAAACAVPSERALTPGDFVAQRIELFVEVGAERFRAHNPSTTPFALFFGDHERGVVESVLLAPGSGLDVIVPERAYDGLWLEIVGRVDGRVRSSGALPLEPLRVAEPAGLLVQSTAEELITWREAASGCEVVATPASILPGPLHVPVIDPEDKGKDEPPPIEEKPLPPV